MSAADCAFEAPEVNFWTWKPLQEAMRDEASKQMISKLRIIYEALGGYYECWTVVNDMELQTSNWRSKASSRFMWAEMSALYPFKKALAMIGSVVYDPSYTINSKEELKKKLHAVEQVYQLIWDPMMAQFSLYRDDPQSCDIYDKLSALAHDRNVRWLSVLSPKEALLGVFVSIYHQTFCLQEYNQATGGLVPPTQQMLNDFRGRCLANIASGRSLYEGSRLPVARVTLGRKGDNASRYIAGEPRTICATIPVNETGATRVVFDKWPMMTNWVTKQRNARFPPCIMAGMMDAFRLNRQHHTDVRAEHVGKSPAKALAVVPVKQSPAKASTHMVKQSSAKVSAEVVKQSPSKAPAELVKQSPATVSAQMVRQSPAAVPAGMLIQSSTNAPTLETNKQMADMRKAADKETRRVFTGVSNTLWWNEKTTYCIAFATGTMTPIDGCWGCKSHWGWSSWHSAKGKSDAHWASKDNEANRFVRAANGAVKWTGNTAGTCAEAACHAACAITVCPILGVELSNLVSPTADRVDQAKEEYKRNEKFMPRYAACERLRPILKRAFLSDPTNGTVRYNEPDVTVLHRRVTATQPMDAYAWEIKIAGTEGTKWVSGEDALFFQGKIAAAINRFEGN